MAHFFSSKRKSYKLLKNPPKVSISSKSPRNEKIHKEGWIFKKSKHLKNYHKRYMQLKGEKLLCYKTSNHEQTKESPTEIFELSEHRFRVDIHETIKEKFYLIDDTSTKARTFKALDEGDCIDWVYQIRHNIISNRMLLQSLLQVQVITDDTKCHDSESEESDNDFVPFTLSPNVSILSDNEYSKTVSPPITPQSVVSPTVQSVSMSLKDAPKTRGRGRSLSKRKQNHVLSDESFNNFRVRALTVDKPTQGRRNKLMSVYGGDGMMEIEEENEEWSQSNNDEEKKEKELTVAVETDIIRTSQFTRQRSRCTAQFKTVIETDLVVIPPSAEMKVELSPLSDIHVDKYTDVLSPVDDEDMIAQLEMFGYGRKSIINAMSKLPPNVDINQITEKLENDQNEMQNIADQNEMNGMKKIDENEQNEIDQNVVEKDINSNEKSESFSQMIRHCNQRRFIEQEIIATEESYYNGLELLLNDLIQPMFDNEFIDIKYYHIIRSSIPLILSFHKDFLSELNKVYHANYDDDVGINGYNANYESIASVFNGCIANEKDKFIEIYMQYITDYDKILDLFGSTFHGNVKLTKFLKEKRRERKALSGFLISPIQRIPRYILLLTDLSKHINFDDDPSDFEDINNAVTMMKNITHEINEKKKKIENLSQCLQIQEALDGLKEPIVNDLRIYIEQFIFIKKEIKHQRLFFMFNDIVIVANEKWKVKHLLDVRTLEVKFSVYDMKKKGLPEFKLISTGAGSATYVAKDVETVNKFKKLVGKWRVQILSGDLRKRNQTLGSLKSELHRQALLYD